MLHVDVRINISQDATRFKMIVNVPPRIGQVFVAGTFRTMPKKRKTKNMTMKVGHYFWLLHEAKAPKLPKLKSQIEIKQEKSAALAKFIQWPQPFSLGFRATRRRVGMGCEKD